MDCIFCKIATHAATAMIIYEDDDVIAFHDLYPKAPIHILVIPKKHLATVADAADDDTLLLGKLVTVAKQIAASTKLTGYKLLFNVGKEGGQVVFHVHLHLLGGWKDGAVEV